MKCMACAIGASVVVAASAFAGDPIQWPVSVGGNGHWYELVISSSPRTWQVSRDAAATNGGHLATVANAAEDLFIRSWLPPFMDESGGQAWLGAYQDRSAPDYSEPFGGWRWVTGEAMGYQAWTHGGNEANYAGADFLALARREFEPGYFWNDLQTDYFGGRFFAIVEWSADCNGDGIVDFGQVRAGQLADLNADNIPDICQCPTPHVVRVPQDAPSIAAAVALACPGNPLEVVVAPGTWVMDARMPTTSSAPILVRGAGGGETIITDAAEGMRLIDTLDGTSFSQCKLKDITVADVSGSENTLTFENCLVRDCVATFLCGPVTGTRFERCSPWSYSAILYTGWDMTDCEFVDCATPILWWAAEPRTIRGVTFTNTFGHAIRVYAGCCASSVNHYTFEDCAFAGTDGNAVKLAYAPHPDAPQVVTEFINCAFTDNIAPAGGLSGGAVIVGSPELDPPLAADRTATSFTACTFTGNRAPSGGAIFMARNHPITLTNCTFAANVATAGDGGAVAEQVYGYGISLVATGCTFVGNQAIPASSQGGVGGAINAAGWFGALELDSCTFTQNAAASGGAVACDRSKFVVQNCSFEDNLSAVDGGAVTVSTTLGGSVVRGTAFRRNSATRHGGALEMPFFITVPFEDCVFDSNTAGQTGGAVRVWYDPSVSFLRCRFNGNGALLGTSVYTFNYGSPLAVTFAACSISNESPGLAAGYVVEADATGAAVGNTVICGCGDPPLSPNVADLGGNCIVQVCDDRDGNGTPDGCQLYHVPTQYGTIQSAIDAVPHGELGIVQVAAGTYHEAFALNGKDVVVRGAPNHATILDGTGLTTSIARFTGGEPATAGVESLVFRNGTAGSQIYPKAPFRVGGALYAANSEGFVRHCEIRQNRSDFGGGIYLYRCGTLIENSLFSGNVASDEGGGCLTFESTATLRSCEFTGNRCGDLNPGSGSGLKSVGARAAGETTLVANCSFTNGTAGVNGSAVEHAEYPTGTSGALRLVNCSIVGNGTGFGAGGLRILGSMQSCTVAAGTTICGNTGRNVDGPFFIEGAVTICDCLADLAQDGSVNGGDLGMLLSAWGLTNAQGIGDANHDGLVNGEDLSIVLSSWGACP